MGITALLRALFSLIFDTIRTKKGEKGLIGITSNEIKVKPIGTTVSLGTPYLRPLLIWGRCSVLYVINIKMRPQNGGRFGGVCL